MTRRISKWWLAAVLLTTMTAMSSCEQQTLYHHYEHTPLSAWEKSDTLFFTVKKMKDRAVIRRDVELRFTDRYPYQQLNIVVEQTTLPSRYMRRDTLDCRLISSKGDILGKGVMLFEQTFHLPDISLNEGDSLLFRIHHNMKRESLPGISDIGIRLTAY